MNQEMLDIIIRVKEMYYRYGIKSVTMDDIARELGVSKKTLYQMFDDKEKLVEAVISYDIELHVGAVDKIIEGSENAVHEIFMIHQFMDKLSRNHSFAIEYDLRKYYPTLHTHILNTKRDRIYQFGKSNIDKGIASGHYRKEVNSEIISKVNLMRFESTQGACLFTPEEMISPDFFNQILEYHVRGIATEKGIELLESLLNSKNNTL